jgi:TonB family protein
MKQVLSALVHGGSYSASTFNLAFYLSNLLKKEHEGEPLEIEKELKVNVAAYAAATPSVSSLAPADNMFATASQTKSRAPLIAIAAVAIIAVAAGAFFIFKPKAQAPVVHAATAPPPPKPKIISQPVIAAAPASTATIDPGAQKKAFEAAVEQKMQEEMMKLQSDMNKQLKQQQSKNAPVQTASVIPAAQVPQPDDRGSAAALDQRRVAARQEAQPATQTVAQQAPALTQTQPAVVPPVAQPQVATIHEGDVIDVTELDSVPQPLSVIHPFYPPLAAQQRAQATIIISALISETGEVADVKILRGDTRFGFNDAAIRAMRAVRFTPPMKDGKHVKTWRPQSITFKM